MDGVNVFATELRTVVKKECPFIPGAFVEFWDSLTVADLEAATVLKDTPSLDGSIDLALKQISGWNFTNGVSPLPLTKDTFKLLSNKLLFWIFRAQGEVLNDEQDKKKESPDNSSTSSNPNTPESVLPTSTP